MVSPMRVFRILAVLGLLSGCGQDSVSLRPDGDVVSSGFRDRDTYVIVCRGYAPAEGDEDFKKESAIQAAILSADEIGRRIFNNTVKLPGDAELEKVENFGTYVVVHYVIKKHGLKKRVRRDAVILKKSGKG